MMNASLLAGAFFTLLLNASLPSAWSQEIESNNTLSVPPSVIASNPTLAASTNATTVTSGQGEVASLPSAGATPTSYRNYSSVHVEGPYIAMSFDDGPSAVLTPKLLDLLKQRGIKVTFFCIGENVERSPEIVARAAAEGHEIGNHTWSHPALTKLSEARVQEQVNKTSEAIFKAIGKKPTLLRPPYGAINPRLTRMIEEQDGMKIILWSVDPQDWKRPGSEVVSHRILAGAKPGAIILSHDIHPGTVEAMPATLDALLAQGYHFVTVSELLAMETKKPVSSVPDNSSPVKTTAKKKKNKALATGVKTASL